MKSSNATSNAQGSKLIIVVVEAGVVKIYVAISGGGEALKTKKERGWTQFITKIDDIPSSPPPPPFPSLYANVLFLKVF